MADRDDFGPDLADQGDNFSRWYNEVVRKAKLADYSPVRGSMVIRPYGFALWENMQQRLDRRIKETGHVNAYFPLLVPESLLAKEAEHVEGFAPEVAWVTQAGNEKLEERYCIRPTSEAIIGAMYSKWVDSWRDLPILINQWANVMRWEKVTRLFLRTAEFLWQEGHTVHRNEPEAEEETLKMLGVYQDFIENELAIPVWAGLKTEKEKFAGALRTYSVEALMRDGKALQAGTSHNLGEHFARVFDITFQDQDGQRKYAWQTSWGVSTRLIGALIMAHGDDSGLQLPPNVAPVQVMIVPIWRKEEDKAAVLQMVDQVLGILKPLCRVQADTDDNNTPGWKYNEYELKGVPLRLEIGPRDVQNQSVVLVRRLDRKKEFVPVSELATRVPGLLEEIQQALFQRALQFREENTHTVRTWDEFIEIFPLREVGQETPEGSKRGFVWANWCGRTECEQQIQDQTKATIRCLPLDRPAPDGPCVHCGQDGKERALFARAY
ncbi:MAG TPA: proline--tRNA ligase [Armatimonadota bacterium]|nr:proline--tRNA ligase [Armatimonadota bacterium]